MTEDARLPTTLRLLRILEVLAEADDALSPTEIGRRVGVPKQTAHRLCRTLTEEGFLEPAPGGRRLCIGRRGRRLGTGLLHGTQAQIARHQILISVAEAFRETVNFVVPEAGGMRYADRVETAWAFRVQLPIGTAVPFHCTASGKVYLASRAAQDRRRMVDALALERHTARTITTPDALMAMLERVNREGFATDDQEFFDGMVAIAVPVRDADGRYLASLAVHGPTPRLSLAVAQEKLPVLREASERLSAALV